MIKKIISKHVSHIIVWAILLFLPFIGYLYEPQKFTDFNFYFLKTHFVNILFLAVVFYLNLHFFAPKYFFAKSRLRFVAVIMSLLLLYIVLSYFMMALSPFNGSQVEQRNVIFIRLIIGPILIYSLCMLTSTILFLYDEQARQKELNKRIEIEKTTAELNMLKLQISPHFLFNTLNNIRWQIRKKSEQAEESVLKLSEILRYIIYDVVDSKVALFNEIDHIRNFIELQSLRLPIEGNIELKVDEQLKNYQIEPLLFIHFVENAFKYGIDSKNAPNILFEFSKNSNGITFHAKNKILLQNSNLQKEGIGLMNTQRRLELLYPNRHELKIVKTEDFFEVNLTIELE